MITCADTGFVVLCPSLTVPWVGLLIFIMDIDSVNSIVFYVTLCGCLCKQRKISNILFML